MAVQKKTPIGDTGLEGDYWALSHIRICGTGDVPGTIKVIGTYSMWVNAAAHADGKSRLSRSSLAEVDVPGPDPRLSEIEEAMDKELTRASIKGQKIISAVEAKPAIEADLENGIKAQLAVKAVKSKPSIQGVQGGNLEGGKIV